MARAFQLLSPNASFRTQLLTTFTIGILLMALVTSLSTAWVANIEARTYMVSQGKNITESLARSSILALLYSSGENAETAVNATLSSPDVSHVSIWDREGSALISRGDKYKLTLPPEPITPNGGAILANDDEGHWRFIAPVVSGGSAANDNSNEILYGGAGVTPELLGYVVVIVSKASLHKMETGILLNNTLTIFSLAALLVAALNMTVRRLTHPIAQLSQTMQTAEESKTHVYAELKGTKEVARMARAFNAMMSALEQSEFKLREHNLTLESQVELRTQELVQARDAALIASRHKSEFLANMSHELRTPIQAIIGYAELLMEEMEFEGRDQVVGDLAAVISNARHLLSMINNILDMAKIEAGRMELKTSPTDLHQLARQARDTMLPLMRQGANEFQVEVEADDSVVDMDGGKLLQIVLNLLANAAKFTQKGKVRLEIRRQRGQLEIAVVDTGVGISAEMQEQIFEEFRQVDMSTTRRFEGTGLGLAITRRLCHLMGGSIAVESDIGAGATFRVTIPLS